MCLLWRVFLKSDEIVFFLCYFLFDFIENKLLIKDEQYIFSALNTTLAQLRLFITPSVLWITVSPSNDAGNLKTILFF